MSRIPWIALTLIGLAAALRLLPHAPNFAPVGAIALFGGAMLGRRAGLVVPVAAMFISDFFLGFYAWPVMASVYGSFLVTVFVGRWIKRQVTVNRVLAGSLTASLLFFGVTNFAVWAVGHGYQPSAAGLLQAYINGLPFFRNTLLSDLFYSGVLFGLTALATVLARRFTAKPANPPPL